MDFKKFDEKVCTRIITGALLSFCLVLFFYVLPPLFAMGALCGIFAQIMVHEVPLLFKNRHWQWQILRGIYPLLPFILLIRLTRETQSVHLLATMWMLVALFDTFSYICGVALGKHKIAPAVSPSKTWEGFMGGLLAVYAGIIAIVCYTDAHLMQYQIIGLACVISGLALLGDLFESWLKRHAGIKDTGNTLPGHGGFLDRFDSILFVGSWACLYKDVLIKLLGL